MSFTDQHEALIKSPNPLMERPSLGFLLAFMAGLTNAWTFSTAQTFSTVQSGNVVQAGYWLVQGNIEKFTFPFISVIAFGIGSALCGVLMTILNQRKISYTPVVLALQALFLFALSASAFFGWLDYHLVAYGVSFVAGAQGNAFHKNNGMLYGNVAVTFVVQMAFNFLAQSLFKREGINGQPNIMWAGLFFLVLLGFSAGGGIGFWLDSALGGGALFFAAVISLVIFIIALLDRQRGIGVDPTPGGLIG